VEKANVGESRADLLQSTKKHKNLRDPSKLQRELAASCPCLEHPLPHGYPEEAQPLGSTRLRKQCEARVIIIT